MLSISSFVFAAGNVWNVNRNVSSSIIFTMSLLYSRCPFHLSVDLVPYDVIELFLRHRIESEKTWTSVSCIFDNSLSFRSIVSQILFRKIWNDRSNLQTTVLCSHLIEYSDVKIPFLLSVFKIMITWLIKGKWITKNAFWFQSLWWARYPYFIDTFCVRHLLSHRLELSESGARKGFTRKAINIIWFIVSSDLP